MLVGLITGKGRLDLQEFASPTPGDAGVVVDISYCGICGTDVHAFISGEPYHPAICGHEWVGTISDKGSQVKRLTEGDRVVVAVSPACGRCSSCLKGQPRYCSATFMSALGRDALAPAHGGFAPRIAVAADRVVLCHPSLSDEEAAQVEPATVAFHAVRQSCLEIGDVAVVQGAGPIGLATLQWVRAAGAGTIVVVEPNESRRQLAHNLGAHHVVEPGKKTEELVREITRGLGADIIYECVGHATAIQSAVNMARRGGSMCLIGLADGTAEINPSTWLVKEITLTAALAYVREEFDMVMAMMADGRYQTSPMHSATVGLQELAAMMDELASGKSSQIKVLVDPRR